MTGFATSVIGCGCEAGIDRELTAKRDPGRASRRAGFAVRDVDRASCKSSCRRGSAQCVLTSPGSACYAGIDGRRGAQARQCVALFRRRLAGIEAFRRQALLAHSRDGRRVCLRSDDRPEQKGSRRRQPDHHGPHSPTTLRCGGGGGDGDRAVSRMSIAPFPGGIARSGSKVGSKYKRRAGVDQRRVLPDAARRGDDVARCRCRARCLKSSSTG